ncbi:hypothetical protein JCM14124_07370 [Humidesulfovibrio idahonensis]
MSTQWRVGFSGATGLDYQAVDVSAKWLGIQMTPCLFDMIRMLEAAQLGRFAEIRERNRTRN